MELQGAVRTGTRFRPRHQPSLRCDPRAQRAQGVRPHTRASWLLSVLDVLVAPLAMTCVLAAAGPLKAEELQPSSLLSEPTDFTRVLDAFERGALPDVSIALSYRRTDLNATIEQEASVPGHTISGSYVPVARSHQITNALSLELGVGLFRDLMVFTRLPLVLSDTRSLSAAQGGVAVPELFDLPYKSTTRSGVQGLDFGVAWGVANQYRTPYLPTWVVSVETRVGLGKLLRPCSDAAACTSGLNRGTATIELGSRWSYRVHWIEPYLGLRYVHEWATAASENFAPHGDLPGYVDSSPPNMQELTLGAAFVAWEDRARFQRLSIDVRGFAEYISAGRDYSSLFDALGTSTNSQLTAPYVSGAGAVNFNGLTNVASHARVAAEFALATQAARYIRFRLGVALSHVTAHLLTDASPCGADVDGTCATERVNLLYRPIIDMPGQRFLQSAALGYDLFANATGEF